MFKPRITKRIPILVEGMYSKFSNLITIDIDGRVFVEYFSETEENDKVSQREEVPLWKKFTQFRNLAT